MVFKCVDDVLLGEVAAGLQELAASILHCMSMAPSSSSSGYTALWPQMSCRLLLDRLLLLHCRSEDVLTDFSGYYCLRVLLDIRSPLATYFIDLFHQLEWLLEALILLHRPHRMGHSDDNSMSLPQDLHHKANNLLRCIRPAVSSCRYLFLVSEFYMPAALIHLGRHNNYLEKIKEILRKTGTFGRRSQGIKEQPPSTKEQIRRWQKEICRKQEEIRREGGEMRDEIHMKREAKADRDLPMDSFRAGLKLLPFGNLDQYSIDNRVELGEKLGEGSEGVVYKGNFVTRKHGDQTQQIIGQPVAVKVFRSGESAGSLISTRELGSQFFNRMEAMVKLKESAYSASSLKESAHSTSSVTTTKCSEMSCSVSSTASHVLFDETEKMTADEELLEELWKLVTAKHPNVISARGYIGRRGEGESGLVMELMSTSLLEYLEDAEEPLQELEMVDVMLETAKGMRFLHECDLVHKDLKPGNILLQFGNKQQKINGRQSTMYGVGTMQVKLADFGSSQRIVAKAGIDICERAGTYCYMAPELLQLGEYKPSTNDQDKMDVFSYGTTCFNILTCRDAEALAFTCASSKASALEFYKAVESNKWRAWVKGKPEYLIDLIGRCWAFDPCQRPTFAAICCLLQRAMLCILAPPVIDEQVLLGASSRNVLRDLYEPIFESSDERYELVGTFEMQMFLGMFYARKSSMNCFLDELFGDYVIPFLEQWSKKDSGIINARSTQGSTARGFDTTSLSARSGCARSKLQLANINAERVNGSNTFESKAVIRLLLQEHPSRRAGAQEYLDIPLTTMDPEWNVFKALVCCSILSHFPSVDGPVKWSALGVERFSLERFPFDKDDAKTHGLDVDKSLLPFLKCFWESGYIGPPGDNM